MYYTEDDKHFEMRGIELKRTFTTNNQQTITTTATATVNHKWEKEKKEPKKKNRKIIFNFIVKIIMELNCLHGFMHIYTYICIICDDEYFLYVYFRVTTTIWNSCLKQINIIWVSMSILVLERGRWKPFEWAAVALSLVHSTLELSRNYCVSGLMLPLLHRIYRYIVSCSLSINYCFNYLT